MFRFIDRERELGFLEEKYREGGKQLIIIYGRRRVGKTELVKHFFRGKDFIYFLADKRGTFLNAQRFGELAAAHFNDAPPRVENFDDVFRYIVRRGKPGLVVAIDEFSYLVERDESIPSVFQLIWDEIIMENEVMLILLGSLISMMEEGVLSYKSPLYGRRTGQWKLRPLPFREVLKFHSLPVERSVEFYAVFGGIPMYLREVDERRDVYYNILNKVIRKGSIFHEEVEFLLREELRDYSPYLSILEALARGDTRVVDIANYSRIPSKDMPKYLGRLLRLDLVGREHPVTEKPKTKKTLYRIKDNFFRFWFRFVYPNKSYIEIENLERVMDAIKREFNSFVGPVFEDVAREFLLALQKNGALPFPIQRVGKWWSRGEEIDLVALDPASKNIAFFEVKWSSLGKRDIDRILRDLMRKASLVQWHRHDRRERYGIIAKKIKGKEKLREKGIHAYDLDDIEEVMEKDG